MEEILNMVANFGFPAVMCLLMYFDNKDTRKSHKEEVDTLSQAVENNTMALNHISEIIKERSN